MTWFADLTPYSYFDVDDNAHATLNVGWLDGVHTFSTGRVLQHFIARLELLAKHGQTKNTRGMCVFRPS